MPGARERWNRYDVIVQFAYRFLLEPGELRSAFPRLRVLRYREGVFMGERHPRAVAGIVARRDL